jgi:hypothetical protein
MISTLAFPPNLNSFAALQIGGSGVVNRFTPDSTGHCTVDNVQFNIKTFLDAGFVVAQLGTTANRPVGNLHSGQPYFDTTLGKPIWRNAANSGWIDATGTAV